MEKENKLLIKYDMEEKYLDLFRRNQHYNYFLKIELSFENKKIIIYTSTVYINYEKLNQEIKNNFDLKYFDSIAGEVNLDFNEEGKLSIKNINDKLKYLLDPSLGNFFRDSFIQYSMYNGGIDINLSTIIGCHLSKAQIYKSHINNLLLNNSKIINSKIIFNNKEKLKIKSSYIRNVKNLVIDNNVKNIIKDRKNKDDDFLISLIKNGVILNLNNNQKIEGRIEIINSLIKSNNIILFNNRYEEIKIKNSILLEDCSVQGNVEIENILLKGNAALFGNAKIKGAFFFKDLNILDDRLIKSFWELNDLYDQNSNNILLISGFTKIFDKTLINGTAKISGNINIYGESEIQDSPKIYGKINVLDDARVSGNIELFNEEIINKYDERFE